jgi:hypothetical protein
VAWILWAFTFKDVLTSYGAYAIARDGCRASRIEERLKSFLLSGLQPGLGGAGLRALDACDQVPQ